MTPGRSGRRPTAASGPSGPDVVFIGPDKTGSTWVHELLLANDRVFVPASKELFYFNRRFDNGPEWYGHHFDRARADQVRTEVGHDYLTFDGVGARFRATVPKARLVVGVRDPIGRLVSSYRYMRLQGRVTASLAATVEEGAGNGTELSEVVDHGRYGHWVDRLLDDHPDAEVATYDFHALEADAVDLARHILGDLVGVDADRFELPPPTNQARSARSPQMIRAGRAVLELARRAGGHDLAAALKRRTLESRLLFSSERYELTTDDRRALDGVRGLFEEDLRLLDERLGTDHRSQIADRWVRGTR